MIAKNNDRMKSFVNTASKLSGGSAVEEITVPAHSTMMVITPRLLEMLEHQLRFLPAM